MTVVKKGQADWTKEPSTMEGIFVKTEKVESLRDKKSEIEEVLKACKAELKIAEESLYKSMLEATLPHFAWKGNTIYMSSTVYATVNKDTKEDFFKACKDNGEPNLVTETVNHQTLSGWVRDQLLALKIEAKEKGLAEPEDLPEWITKFTQRYERLSIGIRKSK